MTDVLPDPMTPTGCDLTDFAFMPLDVLRLRDSELASNETPEACWAAVLLWAASWHQVPAASIPNDDRWIAKAAGYALRGRIDAAWKRVRTGAMRGWVECTDGRLYHSVVAEKAREAWQAKLRQRWSTECGRIKKHNERHEGANVPKPTFEEWLAAGCPQGQPLFVPGDMTGTSQGNPEEMHSKGQGEGQGQGQGQGHMYSAPNGAGSAGASPLMADGPELDPEAKRVLWKDIGDWLVSNRVPVKDAKTFLNVLAGEYPKVIVAALREALKTPAPADAKSFLSGIAKHMSGERERPKAAVTVESNAAEVTRQQLDARSAQPLADAARAAAAEGMQAVTAALRAKAGLGPVPAAAPAPATEVAEVTDGGT